MILSSLSLPYFFIFKGVRFINKQIILIIDNITLDNYSKYYFTIHPKARKIPITCPYHPSINQWMIMKRPIMNALKGKWKDFIVWFIEDQHLTNLGIEECEMTFITYFKTRIRHDCDNFVPKFILDGFSESGLIIDDDSEHVKSLTLQCGYDKNNPRTEIYINILKENDSNE